MTTSADNNPNTPDPVVLSRKLSEIAVHSQKIVADFLARQQQDPQSMSTHVDPLNIAKAFMEMTTKLMSDPVKVYQAQLDLWQNYVDLWRNSTMRFFGGEAAPVIEPTKGDKRFNDPAWQESAVFDFIKQSYLLTSRWIRSTVQDVDGLTEKDAQKVDFYTRQFIDAMSPSNFVATNPEVLRLTIETGGENLLRGLEHMLEDLERGKGKLAISMTDYDAFAMGKNIALTKGKVVFQNTLMQLIQYDPTTKDAFKRPLMIIPPWINKYYILDLQDKNSFIKWAVDQGHTVFILSWANPNESHANITFEDYMSLGPLTALEQIEKATGEKDVNAIGYCLGGTLLSAMLAYMTAKQDARIKSATYFTTLVDFSEPGELGIFIDEEQIRALEEKMNKKGYLEGSEMASTFNMLRSNDLIWSFVVNNYLLGNEPFPFDLLYWNSDSTRLPAKMHSFYLRNMYQKNLLIKKGGITLKGVPIDVSTIETPSFLLSTIEDHIAPWRTTYTATQLYKGDVTFCLAGSGHIAGVINPPAKQKYCYWSGGKQEKNPDGWLKNATKTEGSWWPHWQKWIEKQSNAKVPAREVGKGGLKAIEAAPGSYVAVKYV
jgi:polyhydroxyalkanoate synthase